jgi:hypothetical protein
LRRTARTSARNCSWKGRINCSNLRLSTARRFEVLTGKHRRGGITSGGGTSRPTRLSHLLTSLLSKNFVLMCFSENFSENLVQNPLFPRVRVKVRAKVYWHSRWRPGGEQHSSNEGVGRDVPPPEAHDSAFRPASAVWFLRSLLWSGCKTLVETLVAAFIEIRCSIRAATKASPDAPGRGASCLGKLKRLAQGVGRQVFFR